MTTKMAEGALIRKKSGQFKGRWGYLGVHMRGEEHRVYYHKDDEITSLDLLEEITHEDLSDVELAEYLEGYSDFAGSFQGYADVWFLTGPVIKAIKELEWALSCCEDEASDRIQMIKDVNALGNRPGVKELAANLESFGEPLKKMTGLLEKSLECLKEVVELAEGSE